jgi:hypothetical protein
MPRDEAERIRRVRIYLGKRITPSSIRSGEELARAERQEKKWRVFNRDLLSSMFTTEKFDDEYGASMIRVHLFEDRYNDPSLQDFVRRLDASVRRQVAMLESVIERLGLIDDTTGLPADAPSSHTGPPTTRAHGRQRS